MIRRPFAALLLLLAAGPALAGDPDGPVHVSAGTIVDLRILKSRFADPRRVTQEDFETPAPFALLFGLHAAKQLVGIEPAIGSAGHYI